MGRCAAWGFWVEHEAHINRENHSYLDIHNFVPPKLTGSAWLHKLNERSSMNLINKKPKDPDYDWSDYERELNE